MLVLRGKKCCTPVYYLLLYLTGDEPVGVFLESGFNNILDAATHHPMAAVSPVLCSKMNMQREVGGGAKV